MSSLPQVPGTEPKYNTPPRRLAFLNECKEEDVKPKREPSKVIDGIPVYEGVYDKQVLIKSEPGSIASRTVYISNLSKNLPKQWIHDYFSTFGIVEAIDLRSELVTYWGFVIFKEESSARAVYRTVIDIRYNKDDKKILGFGKFQCTKRNLNSPGFWINDKLSDVRFVEPVMKTLMDMIPAAKPAHGGVKRALNFEDQIPIKKNCL